MRHRYRFRVGKRGGHEAVKVELADWLSDVTVWSANDITRISQSFGSAPTLLSYLIGRASSVNRYFTKILAVGDKLLTIHSSLATGNYFPAVSRL